jgi:phosphoribosylformylglycinamidine (FGAM) synthase-like enzyme
VYDGLFDAIGVPGENPKSRSRSLGDGDTPPPPSGSLAAPLADVPCESLGHGPVYTRPLEAPASQRALNAADPWPQLAERFPDGTDLSEQLLALLATPTIADKSWVWRQYDHQLFLNTVVGPGADAAVLRLKGTPRALAIATDGKGRFCRLDPRTGGRLVVLEAARNVACAGAEPRALVNCLNFGNPEHPEVMWQFHEVVEGMSEACGALHLPVVGGNVSFYNESRGTDIDPTPVVGVIGLIDRLDGVPPVPRVTEHEHLVLLGETTAELGGSEWAAVVHRLDGGVPPAADLEAAARLHAFARDLVAERSVSGVHDCSDGGVAVALAEMAFGGGVGFTVACEGGMPAAAWCFSESASRVVVSVDARPLPRVLRRAADAGIHAVDLGAAGGDRLVVEGAVDVALADAERAWRDAIPNALGAAAAI